MTSNTDALLSHAELVAITGRTRYKAQARALRRMGITRFVERGDGSLVVARALVANLLGLYDEAPNPSGYAEAQVLNLDALRARRDRVAARKARRK